MTFVTSKQNTFKYTVECFKHKENFKNALAEISKDDDDSSKFCKKSLLYLGNKKTPEEHTKENMSQIEASTPKNKKDDKVSLNDNENNVLTPQEPGKSVHTGNSFRT